MAKRLSHHVEWSAGEPVVAIECPDHGPVIPILIWAYARTKIQAQCPVTGHYLKSMPRRERGVAEATENQAQQPGSSALLRYREWQRGRRVRHQGPVGR